nr:hypothetical protein [Alistipes onderdonkii]
MQLCRQICFRIGNGIGNSIGYNTVFCQGVGQALVHFTIVLRNGSRDSLVDLTFLTSLGRKRCIECRCETRVESCLESCSVCIYSSSYSIVDGLLDGCIGVVDFQVLCKSYGICNTGDCRIGFGSICCLEESPVAIFLQIINIGLQAFMGFNCFFEFFFKLLDITCGGRNGLFLFVDFLLKILVGLLQRTDCNL